VTAVHIAVVLRCPSLRFTCFAPFALKPLLNLRPLLFSVYRLVAGRALLR